MFTFKKIDDDSKLRGTSNLMNIFDGFPDDYGEQCALLRGKLQRLMGDPLYETKNLENQYSYLIEAADDEGSLCYITAYRGPSGPSIGGILKTDGIMDAAKEFIEILEAAEPADFHYEGYYPDGPSQITMGVKNGEAYYTEEFMEDEDEIDAMFEELFD